MGSRPMAVLHLQYGFYQYIAFSIQQGKEGRSILLTFPRLELSFLVICNSLQENL
jgi:hypothetical protein